MWKQHRPTTRFWGSRNVILAWVLKNTRLLNPFADCELLRNLQIRDMLSLCPTPHILESVACFCEWVSVYSSATQPGPYGFWQSIRFQVRLQPFCRVHVWAQVRFGLFLKVIYCVCSCDSDTSCSASSVFLVCHTSVCLVLRSTGTQLRLSHESRILNHWAVVDLGKRTTSRNLLA